MKKTIFKTAAMLLVLAGMVACGKENDKTSNEKHGVIPSSIEQVVDVIELKYGEEKEWRYNNQVIKFTVTDVEDNLIDCSTVSILPEYQEEFYKRTRMFASLHVETNNQSEDLTVSSQRCGLLYDYKNDYTDIQDVWAILKSWPIKEQGHSLFSEQFSWAFGTGSKFGNIPFSIYMAKAYPVAYKSRFNVEKNQYKFIFIITKN
ncbi:MAG: hypothetical protein LBP85_02565 [Prevotellaceae bacterium]|jgi:hypothetical protein|nr:hypothetical protein [Prevotellaceae bacterium]